MADPALRPLTLPSLSPDLANLQQLRLQLAQAQERIHGYHALDNKLATFTDEPTWNAYIPLGPLAYFPGQLIHTNDITRVDQPAQDAAADQDAPPRRVLRSAKQAREDAAQAVTDLEAQVVTLAKDIEAAEADLRKKRDDERKLGKGGARASTADMGDEDWTINAQGEVINEEGLPMFDIREDLPLEPMPVASSSKAAQAPPSNSSARARGYLIKKGGKQVVRPLPPPIPTPSSALSPPTSTSQPSPAATRSPAAAPAPAPEADPNPFPARPPLDVKAILDELEAEEAAAAAAAAADAAPPALEGEADEPVSALESKIVELPDSPPPPAAAAPPAPSSKAPKAAAPSSSAFAGFSAGFLAKSKQKRPSNSLAAGAPAARSSPSSSSSANAPTSTSPSTSSASPSSATASTPAPTAAAVAGLKPALSRPVSPSARSRSATPAGDKKRVAFDLPPPSAAEEQPAAKKAPILLGPPPSSSSSSTPERPERQPEPKRVEAPAQRPVRDVVVERPLRKAVPPGGGAGAQGAGAGGLPVREKRLSRFKREAFSGPAAAAAGASTGVEDVVEGKGKGRADEHEIAPSTAPAPPPVAPAARPVEPSSSSSSPPLPTTETMPAPVHTISLSARTSSGAERAPGTVSFGDIPFGSDDEDEGAPHVAGDVDGEEGEDDEDDDWDYSDDDDFDDEELDVDLALHQREVALAYHRQRLMLGAGRGTGPLGGWHAEGENPFGAAANEEADQALVPADATLQSLDPSLAASTFGTYPSAGSAQEGRPSRFRQSNRNLESAQLIIPSLLAADPSLAMSHTPLGPPLGHDGEPAGAGVDDEDERLRRTLEALAEGRPLPEDEQAVERACEIELREELARDKASARRDRTAGKRPPEVMQTVVPERAAPVEVEVRQKVTAAAAQAGVEASVEGQEAEKPKKLSRFRQKQLGLIE
ncbi:hypothetical protein JCM9279_001207 [Rhodotorula babjevae]